MADENTETQTDDLDTLLADIASTETPAETPAETPVEKPEEKPVEADPAVLQRLSRVDDYIERQEAKELSSELSGVAERMKTAVPSLKDLPESALIGYIEREARNSKPIQTAWLDRGSNPDQFNKIVDGLAKKFGDGLTPVADPKLTEDRQSAEAFVSSQNDGEQSDEVKPQSELSAMSTHDLKQYAAGLARSN